jgi:cellulose synthase/poly-beta-1,6-N-acetylglucosamine synthase-like glycosyltransferase
MDDLLGLLSLSDVFNAITLSLIELVVFALLVIQVVYFALFLISFLRALPSYRGKPLPVSVIVCAHDELENLRALVTLLLSQDYGEFEIIVVDDRSNDDTFDFLLAETAKDHRLRMVHVNRTPPHANSKKYALTLGIKAARYEWLLLTDADCRPGKSWISVMSQGFTSTVDFVLGYSPYERRKGLLNLFIRFETLLTAIQYFSFARMGSPFMGVGRNLAYRRSRFLSSKGFHDALPITGGDDDLYINRHARKRNTALVFSRSSQVPSIPQPSWVSFFRQKVRHLSVGKHYRFGHRILLGVFMASWIGTWILGVPVLAISGDGQALLVLFILRLLMVLSTFEAATRKLEQRFESWAIPLLDFIYAFYYLVTGLRALVIRKVKWKS